MKKFIVLWALYMLALVGNGCDVCGIFLGLQPNDRTSTIGLWYRMRYLEGHLGPFPTTSLAKHADTGGSAAPSHYTETFQTMELRADIWLNQRWAIMGSLPVVNNYASSNGAVDADIYGIGDPLVLARYVAVNTKCGEDTTRWRHRLTLGLGGKLPVGKRDVRYGENLVDNDLQPGTGSLDGLLSVEYLLRKESWGLGLNTIGRFNSANSDGFRFGHAVNATGEVFRVFRSGAFTCMPSLGPYTEWAAPDRTDGVEDPGTGGSTLFAHVGSRFWYRALGLTVTWQHALSADQGDHMVPNKERLLFGLTYLLQRN